MKSWHGMGMAALLVLVGASGLAALPTTQMAAAQELHARVTKLERTALGTDRAAADDAVKELQTLGEPAAKNLRDVVRQRLLRDRALVERVAGGLGDISKLSDFQKELDETRKGALANIAKLEHDETLKIAHQYYDRLMKMTEKSKVLNEARGPVLDAMEHRGALLKIWRDLAADGDSNFSEADETKLTATAERIVGMHIKDAAEIPEFGNGTAPTESPQRALWFHRACRQIEAYNKTMESVMDPEEAKDAKMVNTYREALGILPYETDARLVQSARRHSKEMVDLKYFSHESPTASEKLFATRIKNAGYDAPRAENIAAGVADGTAVFWLWFDSPGHHKNMALVDGRALGVGRWGNDFTQNMGGDRLMLRSEEERKKAVIKGEVLPPQNTAAGPARRGK